MKAKRISAYAKKLGTDRKRVLFELAEIAIECKNPGLEDIDVKRLNLQRQTLSRLYECLSEQRKEVETAELLSSVREVEELWNHNVNDSGERESVAAKFGDSKSQISH